MEQACPECGAEVPLTERPAKLLEGSCGGCGHHLTLIRRAPVPGGPAPEPTAVPTDEPAGEEEDDAEVDDEDEVAAPVGPECPTCGGPLTVRLASPTSMEASCPSCHTSTAYVQADRGERPRPPGREFRGRPPRGPRDERGPPRESRPCRECGGALRFSTGEDGGVVGECTSCGNRFTLPPRREFGGGRGGPRPGGRFERGGYGGGPRRWTPRSDRGGGGRFRRRDDSRGDGDEDDRRRRRRPPRRD